jgi:two-component system, chemotaxis family, chemotaxis protein CheY
MRAAPDDEKRASEAGSMTHDRHPVLVVEDEPDIRDLMVAVLESEGYAVRAAAHGAEALAQLQVGVPPCVILLDLMMPVMDGWTFCREKQKHPAFAGIPVVVVSAVSKQDPRNPCAGAVVHLPKPIEIGALLAAVERLC